MALSLFAPKLLRAEVTGGIDLEAKVLMINDRITIGSDPSDDLVLGARGIIGAHLTLQRQENGKVWEYFSSDRGLTAVDKGNPRTGTVRPGMWFNLGGETRIDILKTTPPPGMKIEAPKEGKAQVPLGVALPLMGLMLVGVMAVTTGLQSSSTEGGGLATQGWFSGSEPLEPYVQRCVDAGLGAEASALTGSDPNAPDQLFRTILDNTGDRTAEFEKLVKVIRSTIADTHLLASENRYLEASQTIRRLENVMPVGLGDCPILSAVRSDLTILEMKAGRQ